MTAQPNDCLLFTNHSSLTLDFRPVTNVTNVMDVTNDLMTINDGAAK
jgi:hypothetical protein